jgi:hypothetical protein
MLLSPIRLIVLSIIMVSFAGCASPAKFTTRKEAFNTNALETILKRGESKSSDVQAVLGKPNGTGSLLLPDEKQPRTVLFYEKFDVDTSHMKRVGDYIEIDVRQDVLLIFLKDDYYDGFFWFSDMVKPK